MARTYTTTPIRSYARLSSKRKPKTAGQCGCGCGCPSCRGLECLERPRYFAGQLLTEAELNSEQAYVIAKNRLHNRYLHGWGVVCGLEVVCSNCAGWVSVREGYALDPCGNDIIVCKQTDFHVLDEIRKCLDARRRTDEECPPWQDPNADCKDDEKHWCITIRYEETEARPTMPLRQEGTSSGCDIGCGCGGGKKPANAQSSKSGCGCGGGCGEAPTPPKTKARAAACEPTRILERFRLEIVPQPPECRDAHEKAHVITKHTVETTQADDVAETSPKLPSRTGIATVILRTFAPREFFRSKWVALGGAESPEYSLFNQILAVAEEVDQFLADRMTGEEIALLVDLLSLLIRDPKGTISSDDAAGRFPFSHQPSTTNNSARPSLYDFCCHFRRVLRELYVENPLNVRCAGFDCPPCKPERTVTTEPEVPTITTNRAGSTGQTGSTGPAKKTVNIDITHIIEHSAHADEEGPRSLGDTLNLHLATFATGAGETGAAGATGPAGDREVIICLLNALIDYILDAICIRLLPPCPPTPCDDRLILACVTVKDDKIVHICNFACRHYAGSFNSIAYWTSVVPFVAAIKSVVRKLCCAPHALPALLALRQLNRGSGVTGGFFSEL